ncbi:hypothetical protein HMPREF9080_02187 [Cardiobacterium valvarum F0432]|uniref:Uncharacterized protein n=1 Tax=Cardiobacterium valvarum F0432 TaxID=797473 RepID=G9ZHF7_9GAMM|nr:hypothetical protein HMPREF9080_02187 [Cardiobacterium valvarum F0432]
MQFDAQIIVREARAQGGGETAAFGAGEAGIPDEIAAIGEALVRGGEGIEDGLVVTFLFVGRVDEDDGAAAWWRQAGNEAGKAVTLCDVQAAAEAERTQVILQRLVIGGMQFVEMQFAGRWQGFGGNQGRAGISVRCRQQGAQFVPPGGERSGQIGSGKETGETAVVFAVFLRVIAAEVVLPRSGVGIDVVVGLLFAVVVGKHATEQVVFQEVGVVAGVVGVAVTEHGGFRRKCPHHCRACAAWWQKAPHGRGFVVRGGYWQR